MEEKMKMSAPWVNYYRQIEALFSRDPEIKVTYNEDTYEIKLFIDNSDKALAIEKLIPAEKTFGNVTVKVIVIPSNQQDKKRAELIETAFKGNPAFRFSRTVDVLYNNPISYVVFEKKVVQYPIDNIHDLNGNCSTLYQDIAKEVIGEEEGIFFCTDNDSYSF